MKNCVILGSGRSGTSMVAGLLSKTGYFMGNNLYPGRDSNPKGFFEDPEINGINEQILAPYTSRKPWVSGNLLFRRQPMGSGQKWLLRLPSWIKIKSEKEIVRKIKTFAGKEPFCFKDPRFSYTIPIWKPFLRNTVYVCVFRDPSITASSILKEINAMPYLESLRSWFTFDTALEVWLMMYRHIIEIHAKEGDWIFTHYNQIIDGDGVKRLEMKLKVSVDRSFPDSKLNRTNNKNLLPPKIQDLYQNLCNLANFCEYR